METHHKSFRTFTQNFDFHYSPHSNVQKDKTPNKHIFFSSDSWEVADPVPDEDLATPKVRKKHKRKKPKDFKEKQRNEGDRTESPDAQDCISQSALPKFKAKKHKTVSFLVTEKECDEEESFSPQSDIYHRSKNQSFQNVITSQTSQTSIISQKKSRKRKDLQSDESLPNIPDSIAVESVPVKRAKIESHKNVDMLNGKKQDSAEDNSKKRKKSKKKLEIEVPVVNSNDVDNLLEEQQDEQTLKRKKKKAKKHKEDKKPDEEGEAIAENTGLPISSDFHECDVNAHVLVVPSANTDETVYSDDRKKKRKRKKTKKDLEDEIPGALDCQDHANANEVNDMPVEQDHDTELADHNVDSIRINQNSFNENLTQISKKGFKNKPLFNNESIFLSERDKNEKKKHKKDKEKKLEFQENSASRANDSLIGNFDEYDSLTAATSVLDVDIGEAADSTDLHKKQKHKKKKHHSEDEIQCTEMTSSTHFLIEHNNVDSQPDTSRLALEEESETHFPKKKKNKESPDSEALFENDSATNDLLEEPEEEISSKIKPTKSKKKKNSTKDNDNNMIKPEKRKKKKKGIKENEDDIIISKPEFFHNTVSEGKLQFVDEIPTTSIPDENEEETNKGLSKKRRHKKKKRLESDLDKCQDGVQETVHISLSTDGEQNCAENIDSSMKKKKSRKKRKHPSVDIKPILGERPTLEAMRDFDLVEEMPDFDIPPLHQIEVVRPLNPREREDFERQKVKIKSGKFDKTEDKILLRNWNDFVNQYKVSDANSMLGICSQGDKKGRNKLLKYLKSKHFYVRLAKDLNNRTLYSVYRHARVLLDPCRGANKFTSEEVGKLMYLHSLHGNKWAHIASLMDKTPGQCETSYRVHGKTRNIGEWTRKEDQILQHAVETICSSEEIKKLSTEPCGVSWEKIAKMVKIRNIFQCREHWLCISKRKRLWKKKSKAVLIYMLKNEYAVEHQTLVDWKSIYPVFKRYVPSYAALIVHWNKMKRTVPGNRRKSHAEIVSHLYNTLLPRIMAQRHLDFDTLSELSKTKT